MRFLLLVSLLAAACSAPARPASSRPAARPAPSAARSYPADFLPRTNDGWAPIRRGDRIRGDQMLVLQRPPTGLTPYDRYCVEVGLRDLDTNEVTPIGAVEGGWSMLRSYPHPAVDIAWADDSSDPPAGIAGSTCRHEVDPVTKNVMSCLSIRRAEEACGPTRTK